MRRILCCVENDVVGGCRRRGGRGEGVGVEGRRGAPRNRYARTHMQTGTRTHALMHSGRHTSMHPQICTQMVKHIARARAHTQTHTHTYTHTCASRRAHTHTLLSSGAV